MAQIQKHITYSKVAAAATTTRAIRYMHLSESHHFPKESLSKKG